MISLAQITGCFPTVRDWSDSYLDDGRQRLLGEGEGFSVEIILGDSLDHVGVFSPSMERSEVFALVEAFLNRQEAVEIIFERVREFYRREPEGTFHHILGAHTLTLFQARGGMQLRISPSTDL